MHLNSKTNPTSLSIPYSSTKCYLLKAIRHSDPAVKHAVVFLEYRCLYDITPLLSVSVHTCSISSSLSLSLSSEEEEALCSEDIVAACLTGGTG